MTEQEREQEASAEASATPSTEQPAAASEGVVESKRAARKPAAEPAGPPNAVVVPERVPGTPVVSRRRVLQAAFWTSMGAAIVGAAACGVDMIYPKEVTGFGGTVSLDLARVPPPGGKIEIPEGRFWLVNLTEEQGGPGILALWWKCPHLGCTVPWRPTFVWPDPVTGAPKQGWFRCPCHGSTYTDSGVRVFGPAPRSMDTMDISVSGGRLAVNTGSITPGGPDNANRAIRV
jgi:cytochrome b6-f complex iron-sulfur subunit